jgi:hypothetical protein
MPAPRNLPKAEKMSGFEVLGAVTEVLIVLLLGLEVVLVTIQFKWKLEKRKAEGIQRNPEYREKDPLRLL